MSVGRSTIRRVVEKKITTATATAPQARKMAQLLGHAGEKNIANIIQPTTTAAAAAMASLGPAGPVPSKHLTMPRNPTVPQLRETAPNPRQWPTVKEERAAMPDVVLPMLETGKLYDIGTGEPPV